jgi:uncharacterized membrane protein YfcA
MEVSKALMTYTQLRIIAALVMIILGFIGVIITDIVKDGAWKYWQFLCIVYALISFLLSWHAKKKRWKTSTLTLWHELAHWIGLIGAIFIVSYFVEIGLVSRFIASLLALLLLTLATYLAGVYIETTLIFVGAILGIFALGIAFTAQYLYSILLPLTIAAVIILVAYIYHAHKKRTSSIEK